MFGIDRETTNTMAGPLDIIVMVGVMTWALVKVIQLINHFGADEPKHPRITP